MLERVSGSVVRGYRASRELDRGSLTTVVRDLASAGYAYDSSLRATWRQASMGQGAGLHSLPGGAVWEIPVWSGEMRRGATWLLGRVLEQWGAESEAPIAVRMATWELDPDQPRIASGPLLARRRHYRRLDRMEARLRDFLDRPRSDRRRPPRAASRTRHTSAASRAPPDGHLTRRGWLYRPSGGLNRARTGERGGAVLQ